MTPNELFNTVCSQVKGLKFRMFNPLLLKSKLKWTKFCIEGVRFLSCADQTLEMLIAAILSLYTVCYTVKKGHETRTFGIVLLSAITRVIRIESHDLELKWSTIEIDKYSYCELKFPSSWVLCGHMNMMALIKCVYCGDHMRSLLCCWKERSAEQLSNQNGISFPTVSFPHPLF